MPTDTFPDKNPHPSSGLGSRIAVGALWLVAMRWSGRVLHLVSMFVLARLLMPEDFGISALAVSSIAIAEGLTALPTSQALIRFKDAGRALYDTAWTIGILRGFVIALLMVTCSDLVASLMDEPRLAMVIHVLALKPLVTGLKNPRFIDYEKHLEFSRTFIVESGTMVVSIAITITLAIVLKSYWALVIGNLVSSCVAVVWSYALKPFRPRFSFVGFKKLFVFSGWLSGAAIFRTLSVRLDNFFVGGILNTVAVGSFHLGKEIARTPVGEVAPPLTRALYPGFSMIADDPVKLRHNALKVCSIIGAVVLPLGIGWALIAEEFITLVLGEKWLQIVPIIETMSPVVGMVAIGAIADAIAMSQMRTRLLFYRAAAIFVIRTCLFLFGLMQFGLMGAVYFLVLSMLIYLSMQLSILKLLLGIPFYLPLVKVWRSLISVVCMALAIHSVDGLFAVPGDYWGIATSLFTKVVIGVLTYSVVHASLWFIAGKPDGIERELLSMCSKVVDYLRTPRQNEVTDQ